MFTETRSPVTWQKCPVCEGCGLLPIGFYNPYGQSATNSLEPEKCRTCDGKGIISMV